MKATTKATTKVLRKIAATVAFWALPDYRHPLRVAARRHGLEKTPTDRPAKW